MKKTISIIFTLFFIFITLSPVAYAKEPTQAEKEAFEKRSPLSQRIDIFYALEEPLANLKAEAKELHKKINFLRGKTELSNHQVLSRIRLIEEKVIYFENDSWELTSESEKTFTELNSLIADLGLLLGGPTQLTVLIEGKTDGVGTDMHNFALSAKRGIEVKNALMKTGLPEFMFRVLPFGEYRFRGNIGNNTNPNERVVSFTVVCGVLANDYENLLTKLSIVENMIRNMELLVLLEKHEIEWPYEGAPNPYHKHH